MYRCTECHAEYQEYQEYCDCGNDTFEEILEDDFQEEAYYEPPRPVKKRPPKKPKLSPEEIEEMEREAKEKTKSKIAAFIILVLVITVFFLPPYPKKKMEKVKERVAQEQLTIPQVDTYWDNSVPSAFRKTKDPLANLPLLNERFRYLSADLRQYLVEIGSIFDKKWDKTIVSGSGEAKVEFTIDKEGNIASKRIIASTHNDSLDHSVLYALSKVISFNVPPDDYKGERIYISFKVEPNGASHVMYPNK